MKIYEWKEGTTSEEAKDGAYWERNMLALLMAKVANAGENFVMGKSGWYYDTDNNWDGWKRVISIDMGTITFHIPDDFDVGDLPEIEPNWNGHTTKQKWEYVMDLCGCEKEEVDTSGRR